MEDFIGIQRKIVEHWVYKDSQYFHAWFEMLRCARFSKESKTDVYEGVIYTLNYAEFIFGRPSWSKRLNIGEEKLRTLIKRLLTTDMIVCSQKHAKFTIYKIINYEKYNQHSNHVPDLERSSTEDDNNQHNNQQPTSSQPAANQQPTTKEECSNKDKKENKEDHRTALEIAIDDFKELRKKIKKPMTNKAVDLLLKKLNTLASDDETKIAILNESIVNSWQGVFPLKQPVENKTSQSKNLIKAPEGWGE